MDARHLASAVVGMLACVAACSSSSSSSQGTTGTDAGAPECTEGTPGCIGWLSCPPEFEKDDAGGCREVLPAADCPAGTMPVLGGRDCAPVGTTKCADGFAADASGWGCHAVLPAQTCAGPTRDAIGSATCAPVGDCNAAFPPAGALLVDAGFTDGDLGPTKFKTIAAAVAAAKSGDVVAIEAGDYAEGIAGKSGLTVVGRCPEKVRLLGTGLEVQGVLANGTKGVSVKGVTLVDHYEGARAQGGGTLTLEDVVIETPRFTGLIAWQSGSSILARHVVVRDVKPHDGQTVPVMSANADEGGSLELVESSITGSWEAGIVATNYAQKTLTSSIKLTRSVIRDTNVVEHSQAGAAFVVSDHSTGEIAESAIVNTRRVAVAAGAAPASIRMTQSEVLGTQADSGQQIATAVDAEGGAIQLTEVSVHDAMQAGIQARGKGSVTATNTVVHGTKAGKDGIFGMGAYCDGGSTLALENVAFVDNAYYGVAVLTAPSKATLKNVLVRGTAAQKTPEGGLGRGVNLEDGAVVDLDTVSMVANDGEGLFVRGETAMGERAHATAKRLLVDDGRTADATGIFVAKGGLLETDGAVVRGARHAGVVVNETVGGKGSHSEASLTHTIIRGTQPIHDKVTDPKLIALDGIGIGSAGKLTLRSSAVLENVQFGVVIGSVSGTTIEDALIASTKPDADGAYGHGFVAYDGANPVIRSTEISGNDVGLFFQGTGAIVAGSRVRSNAIGLHTQHDVTVTSGAQAPDAPDARVVFVSDDSEFVDNATRVSGDDLPLPGDPFATAGK